MVHQLILSVAIILTGALAPVYAETNEPENGPELVKLLKEKYGVQALLDREGRFINVISLEDVADLPKAIDRIVEIPTVQEIEFHWELKQGHVDGTNLKRLAKLPKLLGLNAIACGIQDDDLAGIEGLVHLKQLRLDANPITDAGLMHLKSLKDLELLYLDGTKVTGTGFENLQGLPRLRNLYLRGTPITDTSMIQLGQIKSLRVLVMSNTNISNEGLMHLTGLYLLNNLVTEAKGSEEFRQKHARTRKEAEKQGLVPKNYRELSVIGR